MRVKQIFTSTIGIMVISLLFLVPVGVNGATSPVGWAAMPVSDAADDVLRYTDLSKPGKGVLGDYHNEIDLQSITMSKGDLCLNFNETPLLTNDYWYSIYIDSDGDENTDAIIIWPSSGLLVLFNYSTNTYWNSTSESWSATQSNLSHTFNEGQLALENIDIAISNISTANIGITVCYVGDPSYYYADFTPLIPDSGGIPGYTFLLTLFSLLTLLGLVFLQQKRKI